MKISAHLIAACLLSVALVAPSFAQEDTASDAPSSVKVRIPKSVRAAARQATGPAPKDMVATPSQVMVPLPKVATATVASNIVQIPSLPPSEPCRPTDILGMWRLVQVYESPEGTEKAAFVANPMQYIYYKNNATFARYNAGTADLSPLDVYKQMNQYTGPLLQHVLQKGMLFFYQDQKVSDTQACFIVRTPHIPFVVGQMLLMPPKGQIQGRLIKVYQRAGQLWLQAHPRPSQPQRNR